MPLNLWDQNALSKSADLLDECVYGSQLLGKDPSLVLHGGGNTSVKTKYKDVTGIELDAIYIKGSGWDLATIERAGFAALPLSRLLELLELESLSDREMMRELSAARFDDSMPQPSVEALLHAFLPFPAIQHSHADVILALTNTPNGDEYIKRIFGNRVLIVQYVMPGFDLARELYQTWEQDSTPDTLGIVLMNHGLFSFGETTRQAYSNHLELINEAEAFVKNILSKVSKPKTLINAKSLDAQEFAALRRKISAVAGRPMIVKRECDASILEFVKRPDLSEIAKKGPLTPDHVIRTKRIPLIGQDVDAYSLEYLKYFERNHSRSQEPLEILDKAPRILLDPQLGMLAVGTSVKEAIIAGDIYRHTLDVVTLCQDYLGGWQALPEELIFDVEYWELEQAKIKKYSSRPILEGQVSIVTGAASGIGKACALELMTRGSAIIAVDQSAEVTEIISNPNWHGVVADVTDHLSMQQAIVSGVEKFGGIDIAVIAAGIFGETARISELKSDGWRKVMAVNTDAVVNLMSTLHPLLKISPIYGRVVIIGSKNVVAPGLGAVAYSASKAATTQIARIAALEWAQDRIRVNVVHPDAVFDTGLWTEEIILARAKSNNLSVNDYKSRNLLRQEIKSDHVGKLVAELCGPAFVATTGAQISIDGGNDRTI